MNKQDREAIKAIRKYCKKMCVDRLVKTTVAKCPETDCTLWPYRLEPKKPKYSSVVIVVCSACKAKKRGKTIEPYDVSNGLAEVQTVCAKCGKKLNKKPVRCSFADECLNNLCLHHKPHGFHEREGMHCGSGFCDFSGRATRCVTYSGSRKGKRK